MAPLPSNFDEYLKMIIIWWILYYMEKVKLILYKYHIFFKGIQEKIQGCTVFIFPHENNSGPFWMLFKLCFFSSCIKSVAFGLFSDVILFHYLYTRENSKTDIFICKPPFSVSMLNFREVFITNPHNWQKNVCFFSFFATWRHEQWKNPTVVISLGIKMNHHYKDPS